MSTTREDMDRVFKTVCVPHLRKLGFKGSYPEFHCEDQGFTKLIAFQFFSSGGSVCVNLSYVGRNRENLYWKKDAHLTVTAVRISHTTESVRLGAPDLFGDKWFSFGLTSYGEFRGDPQPPSDIAQEVIQLLESQAKGWWESKRNPK